MVRHRDRVGAAPLRAEIVEDHWSYMDRFERELIARGPMLDDDETPIGSIHLVDLPDEAAAWAFACGDPNYRRGVCNDVTVRPWRNLLGRTMWQFPGGQRGARRYAVVGLAPSTGRSCRTPADTCDLIAYGPLLTDDGTEELGVVALLRADTADAARDVLLPQTYADVNVCRWEFGGR
ncbi:YciI family protein [Microlunatus elymi]|nr:YciI family protein [Microlunatus elymi]